jgi:DNA polymerase-3 subunit epsilon
MKIFFYDLETTGLSYTENGIIQLAGIMTNLSDDNKLEILDELNIEVCPRAEKKIETRALEVNGYSLDRVKDLQPDSEGFKEFLNFMRRHINRYNKYDKCFLAGYNNIHFDNNFMRRWFTDNESKYFGSYFWSTTIDVLAEATRYFLHYRALFPNMKLKTLAKATGMKVDDDLFHDALYDVRCTISIFQHILENNYIKEFDMKEVEKLKFLLQDDTESK